MKLTKLEGGKILKGKSMKNPLITIVTVVYNGEKTLERAIKSVINQTYKNIEYIIIDGNSTDKTFNIIKKYSNKIDYWISEPDKGIYDAMNKGINLARGKYINFLGCDDYFLTKKILSKVQSNVDGQDLIYGKAKRIHSIYGIGESPERKLNVGDISKGKRPCHQAMFVRTNLMKAFGGFNNAYTLASDFDIVSRLFKGNYNIKFLNDALVFFNNTGAGTNFRCTLESGKIIKNYFGNFAFIKCIIFPIFQQFIRIILTKIGLINFSRKILRMIKRLQSKNKIYNNGGSEIFK
jgi:glycosyltransferase involved in cell wall biosynthesis